MNSRFVCPRGRGRFPRSLSGSDARGRRRSLHALSLALAVCVYALVAGCGNSGDPFGLVTPDVKIPVTATRPADGDTGVSVNTLVTIAFPTDLDIRTAGPSTFGLMNSSGLPVSRSVHYDDSSRVVTLRPYRPLAPRTIHQVVIQGVQDVAGNGYATTTFTFGTGDAPADDAPEVIAVTPVPAQQNVNVASNIVIEFSRGMNTASVLQAFTISDGIAGTISFDAAGKVMTFDPAGPLPLGRTVRIQVSREALDVEGVPLRVGFSSYFSTPEPDSFKIVRSVPADGAVTASPSTLIQFTFSEPVDRTTVTTNFRISATGLAIPVPSDDNFTFSNHDQVVTYDPAPGIPGFVGLPGGSQVRTTFVQDVHSAISGVGLPRDHRLSFTVENFPPQIVETEPLSGATDQPADQVIRFTFSEPLDTSTVDSSSFSVTQGPVVTGVISFEDGDRTVVFTPNNPYQNSGVPVIATADTSITDRGGTNLAAAVTVSFNIDTLPAFVSSRFPADTPPDNEDVPVTLQPLRRIQVTFNEDLDQSATAATFTISPDSSGGQVGFLDSRTLVYTPPVQSVPVDPPAPPNSRLLTGATTYTVSFTAFDLASNSTAVSWQFFTDDDPPTIIQASPSGTSSVTTTVQVVFNELMNKDTIPGAITFRRTLPTAVDISVTPTVDDTGFQFSPPLAAGSTYELLVDTSITDLGGVPLQSSFTMTFSTP